MEGCQVSVVSVKYTLTLKTCQTTELTGLGTLCFQFFCVIDFDRGVAVSGYLSSSGTILGITLCVLYIYICLIHNQNPTYIFYRF